MNREEYMRNFEQYAGEYTQAYRNYDGSDRAFQSLMVSKERLLQHLRLNLDLDSLGIEVRMDDDERVEVDITAELQSLYLPDGDLSNIYRSED